MPDRIVYFCVGCGKADIIDKGAETGTCSECHGTDWRSEEEILEEPGPFEVSLNDRRFLRSLRISPD